MASETVQPTPSALDSVPNPQKFSIGASPLTIVAFLAMGIFIISIVFVFGWRRVQNQRSIAAEIRELEDVPKLRDLWSDRTEGGMEGGRIKVRVVARSICTDLYHCAACCCHGYLRIPSCLISTPCRTTFAGSSA